MKTLFLVFFLVFLSTACSSQNAEKPQNRPSISSGTGALLEIKKAQKIYMSGDGSYPKDLQRNDLVEINRYQVRIEGLVKDPSTSKGFFEVKSECGSVEGDFLILEGKFTFTFPQGDKSWLPQGCRISSNKAVDLILSVQDPKIPGSSQSFHLFLDDTIPPEWFFSSD